MFLQKQISLLELRSRADLSIHLCHSKTSRRFSLEWPIQELQQLRRLQLSNPELFHDAPSDFFHHIWTDYIICGLWYCSSWTVQCAAFSRLSRRLRRTPPLCICPRSTELYRTHIRHGTWCRCACLCRDYISLLFRTPPPEKDRRESRRAHQNNSRARSPKCTICRSQKVASSSSSVRIMNPRESEMLSRVFLLRDSRISSWSMMDRVMALRCFSKVSSVREYFFSGMWSIVEQVRPSKRDLHSCVRRHFITVGSILLHLMPMDSMTYGILENLPTFSKNTRRSMWFLAHGSSKRRIPMYHSCVEYSSGEGRSSLHWSPEWTWPMRIMDIVCFEPRWWIVSSSPWMVWSMRVSSSTRSRCRDSILLRYQWISTMTRIHSRNDNDSVGLYG